MALGPGLTSNVGMTEGPKPWAQVLASFVGTETVMRAAAAGWRRPVHILKEAHAHPCETCAVEAVAVLWTMPALESLALWKDAGIPKPVACAAGEAATLWEPELASYCFVPGYQKIVADARMTATRYRGCSEESHGS